MIELTCNNQLEEYPQFRLILEEMEINHELAVEMMTKMSDSINMSLNGKKSSLKMINTHVNKLPTRNQNGSYYGIDLGGSNLRVLCIKFTNGKMEKWIEYESITEEILNGDSEQLFDVIADVLERCARNFSQDDVIDLKTIGFTFSFPVQQHSLISGTLMHWTKGFNVKNVVGNDVSKLLMDSITRKHGITADNVALLNDTVGTLLCGAQLHDNVCIGFIMGTGCNACYIENSSINLNGNTSPHLSLNSNDVIINTEFGGFGTLGELDKYRNKYEIEIDQNSLRPGEQIYEKMISGLYIVDIFKQVITNCKNFGYLTNFDINNVTAENFSAITDSQFKDELNNPVIDLDILHLVAVTICERVAIVVACGLCGIIKHMRRTKVTISADGSVIQKNNFIRNRILHHIKLLVPNVDVSIVLVRDGSGTGAAILASTI